MNITAITESNELEVHVTFRIPNSGAANTSFMAAEEALAQHLGEIGLRSTTRLLTEHDSKGEPLSCDNKTWWTKGQIPRLIESPYGAAQVLCHVYQTSLGGNTRVPLEERANLIASATPKFAQMISSKLAQIPCGAVANDMATQPPAPHEQVLCPRPRKQCRRPHHRPHSRRRVAAHDQG